MSSDSTAQKYAEALYGIGKSSGKLAVFQANAEDFLKIFEGSRDLMTSLSHPNIRKSQRKAIVDEILRQCDYDAVFGNFLRLVVERGRMAYYPKMVSHFRTLRDEADGRLRGVVYVASPLTPAQRDKLRARAQEKLGHEVILEERIDPALIGGLKLEIDGRVYDGTVQRYLERLRLAMGED